MWNFKKFTSGLAAMAVAASAFVAVPISAGAATTEYSDDFEGGTVGSWESISGSISAKPDPAKVNANTSSYVLQNGPASGSRRAGVYPFATAPNTGVYRVSFDVRMDVSNSSQTNSLRITGSKETQNWFQDISNGGIFYFEQVSDGGGKTLNSSTYKINGVTVSGINNATSLDEGSFRDTSGWLNINVIVDLDNKTESYSIVRKSSSETIASGSSSFTASQLLGIETVAVKSYGGIFMDNVLIEKLTPPEFTVDSTANVSVGGSMELDVTGIVGTVSSTVATSDATVATASYADGKLTINGVSEGVTTLTVSASNDGLQTTKDIVVTVGAIVTVDVITNYYITGTNTAVPDKTSSSTTLAVGDTITASDIDTATVTKSDARYVYNSVSINGINQNPPYTIASGDNITVNVYFNKQDAISSIDVNYTYSNEIVYTDQIALTDKYVGDTVDIPFRMYIQNNGILYKTTKNNSNPWYGDTVTLTENAVHTKTLALSPYQGNIVLFEDLDDSTAQNADIRASYKSAYDNKAYTSTNDIPSGVYTFIFYVQNKGRNSSINIGNNILFGIADLKEGTGSWEESIKQNVIVEDSGQLSIAAGSSKTRDDYDIIIAIKTGELSGITPKYVAANGTTELAAGITSNGFGGSNGSTIATAFALNNSIAAGSTVTGLAWDITVPSGSYVKTTGSSFDTFKSSTEALTGTDIFATTTGFNLRFVHEMPAITGANVLVGLVINNVYVNGGSASASYITDTYATATASGGAYDTYDKLTVGPAVSGVYDMTLDRAATSETTAFGELMSIDSILTMMYDEDELAEITGDIASEDNADITGIDDEIDMTDNNDGGEAVGEME